jgi:hypothetical protein
MSRAELEQFLDERTFRPFVLTTVDGFALPVPHPRRALLGLGMIVIADGHGRLYNVPLGSIAHISEAGEQLD